MKSSTFISMYLFVLVAWAARLALGEASAGLHHLEMRDTAISHLHRINAIHSCDQIVDLCQERSFTVGAELGVQIGIFAEKNLKRWTKCEKYYLIDLWKHQENYEDIANAEDSVQLGNLNQTVERLSNLGASQW